MQLSKIYTFANIKFFYIREEHEHHVDLNTILQKYCQIWTEMRWVDVLTVMLTELFLLRLCPINLSPTPCVGNLLVL